MNHIYQQIRQSFITNTVNASPNELTECRCVFPRYADDILRYAVSQRRLYASDADDENKQAAGKQDLRKKWDMSSEKQDQSPRHSCDALALGQIHNSWRENDLFD